MGSARRELGPRGRRGSGREGTDGAVSLAGSLGRGRGAAAGVGRPECRPPRLRWRGRETGKEG